MDLFNTISNNRFWKKNRVHLMWALALLCLALALSRIIWNVYSQGQIKEANYRSQNISPIATPPRESYRLSDIVSANLFGDPTPAPKAQVAAYAPKTTLNLSLQGVFWASETKLARAIIAVGKKKAELYSVGENIRGANASIKEIRPDEVLLDRNGATESLPMVKLWHR
jgi:type II secretion system protein C